MNTTSTTLHASGTATAPPGAMTRRLARAAAAVVAAVRASGQARARSEMLSLAEACADSQPRLAAELRAASALLGCR